jgi:hypothetical protein
VTTPPVRTVVEVDPLTVTDPERAVVTVGVAVAVLATVAVALR